MGILACVGNVCKFSNRKKYNSDLLEEYIKLNYDPPELIRAHIVPASDDVRKEKVAEDGNVKYSKIPLRKYRKSCPLHFLDDDFTLEEPFAELLIEHMNKKGLESTDVYKACNMTKANFSNQLDPKHKPSKKSVLALCIGLKLSLEESNHFLSRAGFSFSSANLQDVIVKYFLTESIYDIGAVNSALYEHKVSTIP